MLSAAQHPTNVGVNPARRAIRCHAARCFARTDFVFMHLDQVSIRCHAARCFALNKSGNRWSAGFNPLSCGQMLCTLLDHFHGNGGVSIRCHAARCFALTRRCSRMYCPGFNPLSCGQMLCTHSSLFEDVLPWFQSAVMRPDALHRSVWPMKRPRFQSAVMRPDALHAFVR